MRPSGYSARPHVALRAIWVWDPWVRGTNNGECSTLPGGSSSTRHQELVRNRGTKGSSARHHCLWPFTPFRWYIYETSRSGDERERFIEQLPWPRYYIMANDCFHPIRHSVERVLLFKSSQELYYIRLMESVSFAANVEMPMSNANDKCLALW